MYLVLQSYEVQGEPMPLSWKEGVGDGSLPIGYLGCILFCSHIPCNYFLNSSFSFLRYTLSPPPCNTVSFIIKVSCISCKTNSQGNILGCTHRKFDVSKPFIILSVLMLPTKLPYFGCNSTDRVMWPTWGWSALKGGIPTISSKRITPTDHQSAVAPTE